MSVDENKDFSNINTTKGNNHTYEEIFEEIRLSKNYSSIDQYQKGQNHKYDDLAVAAKPRNKRSFRIVALIVASIVALVVILSIIFTILATTSNL